MYSLNRLLAGAAGAALIASLAACGGGGGSSGSSSALSTGGGATTQSANLPVMISDASSEDWAVIGVDVLSVALVPQGGGAPVTVFTAPASGYTINLVQLDQISDIIENTSVPVGTYTGATITVSANPGDVTLTTAAQPESGFAAPASTTLPSSQIQIQGASGAAGSKTVPIKVSFDSPLVVTTTTPGAVNIEFDLAHPAFIVGHQPPGAGTTLWAINFNGPVRQRRVDDLRRLVLRHSYGTVSSVSSDDTSITIAKDVPALPVQTPETAVATGQSLTILADATNGTLFYDLDAATHATIKDFSSVAATLPTKYVRVAARYQQNGTLVATRVYASTTFSKVWISPEGHVYHVLAPTAQNPDAVLVVSDESGKAVPVAIDGNTQFYFRTPANPSADVKPIGSGPAFAVQNLVRGFKVHVAVTDPLAASLTAQSVDIETANFNGQISAATGTGFTYTRKFPNAADDYTTTLDFIAPTSANGTDSSGNAIEGFKYWNFAYPTLVTSGANAMTEFGTAVNGAVNFGGTVGPVVAEGISYAWWGDSANPTGWTAPWVVIAPTLLPRGSVATGLVTNPNGADTFTMSITGGTTPVTVDVSAASGSSTLVYQVDRTNGVVTVSSEDVTTSAGLTALTNGLAAGAPVRVYGVPQADTTLKAYVLTYFTGDMPAN